MRLFSFVRLLRPSPVPRRFVILSGSRSGTSLLSETLNIHPDILCHGELFHPTPASHLRIDPLDRPLDEVMALRTAKPRAYLDWALDRPAVQVAGFKMWRMQDKAVCDALLKHRRTRKIIYERDNILARYSSSLLVKATGIYNLKPDGRKPAKLDTRIGFDKADFLVYLRKHRALFAHYREKARGPVLDLRYRDVVADGLGPVLAFLGVADHALPPQKQKLHGSDILSRFAPEDHGAVVETLAEIGHPDWVRE